MTVIKTTMLAIGVCAAAVVSATANAYQTSYQPCPGSAYINLEGGISYSQEIHFTPGPPWDPSPEGYDADLGHSEVLGAGLGYIINPALRAEITVDHRNSFDYEKFQTSPATLGSKTRNFDLKSTTVMANLFIDGSGIGSGLAFRSCYFMVDPFINAGIGSAFNTVDNFHSTQTGTNKVFSLVPANTQTSFAYQVGAGFTIKTCSHLALGVGYRYVDAGNFSSNTYFLDNPDNPGVTSGAASSAWKPKLKTNEVYASLHYNFD